MPLIPKIVYCIKNLLNDKKYVGQTVHTLGYRWSQHKSSAKYGSDSHFHRAIRKYGTACWELSILGEYDSLEALSAAESNFIIEHQTMDHTLGYNSSSGGERPHLSPESIEKMAKSLTGRRCPHVVESNRRRRGEKHSLESRQRRSELHKEMWRKGILKARPKTPATCHPDRFVKGNGLCSSCWQNKRYHERKKYASNT